MNVEEAVKEPVVAKKPDPTILVKMGATIKINDFVFTVSSVGKKFITLAAPLNCSLKVAK